MGGIEITSKGSWTKSESWLARLLRDDIFHTLDRFGKEGADALARATPEDSGETARSWSYEILKEQGKYSIIWTNSHVEDGVPIAILIQYDHGTKNGGFVQGRDYINPALQPIFDRIAAEAWKVVTS